jgi:large subunit ribosomal protein L22
MRPAPQGRGYRVRKRSNHVTVIVDDAANAKPVKAPKAEAAKLRKQKQICRSKTKKAAPKKAAKKTATKKANFKKIINA